MVKIALAAALALLAAGAAGAWAAAARWWPLSIAGDPGATLPGLLVDGHARSQGQEVRGLVESRARALEARRVRLVAPGAGEARVVLEATLGDLGVSVDVDAGLARAPIGRASGR